MIAFEQFNSMSHMTTINMVMATLESLSLLTHQKEDYAKGFEYVGPDVDASARQELFRARRREHGLVDCTVGLSRLKVDLEATPWPRIEKFPINKKYMHHYAARDNWDENRIEEERQRSVANSEKVCRCGTFYDSKGKFDKGNFNRGRVHTGFKKRSRCKNCEGCLAPKCGVCQPCLRPPLKKPCIERVCKFPVIPKCPCFD